MAERLRIDEQLHAEATAEYSALKADEIIRETLESEDPDLDFPELPERLATLRAQTPKPYVARSRELVTRRGDVVLARFFSSDLWVLEAWTLNQGRWMVLMSQVTTAKVEPAGTQP